MTDPRDEALEAAAGVLGSIVINAPERDRNHEAEPSAPQERLATCGLARSTTGEPMTDLSALEPSTLGPIGVEELRSHPLRGAYHYSLDDFEAILRIDRWSGGLPRCSGWLLDGGGWTPSAEARAGEFRYLLAPALTFSMTIPQMRERSKWVTRRRNVPRWWPNKSVFNARSGSFGDGRPDYLGTFRVESAEMQGRWRCPDCREGDVEATTRIADPTEESPPVILTVYCHRCGRHMPAVVADTLTPAELGSEGFPEADPDEFWAKLVKHGMVNADGQCCRIAFGEVA